MDATPTCSRPVPRPSFGCGLIWDKQPKITHGMIKRSWGNEVVYFSPTRTQTQLNMHQNDIIVDE